MSAIKLPRPCGKCGCLEGKIVEAAILCAKCHQKRGGLGNTTQRFLQNVTQIFGEPEEIVLRKGNALTAIEQQDRILKSRRVPDGRTYYDVVSEAMQPAETLSEGISD